MGRGGGGKGRRWHGEEVARWMGMSVVAQQTRANVQSSGDVD